MPHFDNTIAQIEKMSTSLSKVSAQATQLQPVVEATSKKAREAQESIDELDILLTKSLATQNDFSAQLEIDIERVRLGSIDIRDFISTWGDAVIATDEGFRTIREQFSGADLGKYQREIQDLIAAVSTGAAELADVIGFLKENVPTLGKGLIDVLELFKQGKATLEDVQRVIEATKKAFPGLEADALADAIQQALLGGNL